MLRWSDIRERTVFGLSVKMYREPYSALKTIASAYQKLELDHQAYQYFNSELFMYKILDVNFEQYIEERGDLDRIKKILIPTSENTLDTVL